MLHSYDLCITVYIWIILLNIHKFAFTATNTQFMITHQLESTYLPTEITESLFSGITSFFT